MDDYARNGFKVYAPDIFHDPAPPEAFDPGYTFNFGEWFARNSVDYTEPRTRQVLSYLKGNGIKKVGVLGYCYSARLCFNLAFDNEVDVVVVSHPSLLQVPTDIEVR